MFTDTEFMSAQDKTNFMRAWLRWQRGGYKRTQFTKAIYQHLHMHCGFIAHFNIDGFYAARIADDDGFVVTMRQLRNEGAGYRGHSDYNDINKAIAETINIGEIELDAKEATRCKLIDALHSIADTLRRDHAMDVALHLDHL